MFYPCISRPFDNLLRNNIDQTLWVPSGAQLHSVWYDTARELNPQHPCVRAEPPPQHHCAGGSSFQLKSGQEMVLRERAARLHDVSSVCMVSSFVLLWKEVKCVHEWDTTPHFEIAGGLEGFMQRLFCNEWRRFHIWAVCCCCSFTFRGWAEGPVVSYTTLENCWHRAAWFGTSFFFFFSPINPFNSHMSTIQPPAVDKMIMALHINYISVKLRSAWCF